jgi:hypothetical protein
VTRTPDYKKIAKKKAIISPKSREGKYSADGIQPAVITVQPDFHIQEKFH